MHATRIARCWLRQLETTKAPRHRWIAPRDLDGLVPYGIKVHEFAWVILCTRLTYRQVNDAHVGVGASGQIFSGTEINTGTEVAIKMVRGIFRQPRAAQNVWREEPHLSLYIRTHLGHIRVLAGKSGT